ARGVWAKPTPAAAPRSGNSSRLFDGAARPPSAGEGDRPNRRRHRTRVLLFLSVHFGWTRRDRITAWTGPTRAGRTRVPPWRAAGRRLQLQARAGAGGGL